MYRMKYIVQFPAKSDVPYTKWLAQPIYYNLYYVLFAKQFRAAEKLLCDRASLDEREALRLVLRGESPLGFCGLHT